MNIQVEQTNFHREKLGVLGVLGVIELSGRVVMRRPGLQAPPGIIGVNYILN
ncbi:hypothetical protein [Priestia aryabhattai]|uniref:hypothetical protein n=1 Tax=Priestia aryabhattai TaxID=412384 RepID=UPI001ADBD44F|nr:hypothetical protein [Priestia aryabhattai]QTL51236.1 hypothetical protein J5Z55_09215 [Priestia aryabhattai]